MRDVSIRFEPSGVTVRVPHGSLLLDAARQASVAVDAPCGGIGRCGRCRVVVAGDISPLTEDERLLLTDDDRAAGVRLACRARVHGDALVRPADPLGRIRVLEDAMVPRPVVEPPALRGLSVPDAEEALLGVAVDIGTTTLALALVDLRNGDEIAHATALNPQHPWGADIMSRVTAALSGEADALRERIAEEIERLALGLVEQVGGSAGDVREFSVAANTAMRAILLGEDVSALAEAPYAGSPVHAGRRPASEIGMHAFDAEVGVVPGVSAFIGGDVVAGLLVTGMVERITATVFIDLGTNGEVVVLSEGQMVGASAAAGPALEGASISSGMRAEPGAVERVRRVGDDLEIETIDDAPPRGICGSGLLDLVAVMRDIGALDASGRISGESGRAWSSRVIDREDQRMFVLAGETSVALTQRDIRELQLAKGAIRTAIEMTLEAAGVSVSQVTDVIVAGAFGRHARAESLATIGMIPSEWVRSLRYVGNTSLAGAVATLVNSEARASAARIAADVRTVDLASDPTFEKRFLSALELTPSA